MDRRTLLIGSAAAMLPAMVAGVGARPGLARPLPADPTGWVDVRRFGARGDGTALDSVAINRAIQHVGSRGGGTVYVPPGIYRCFSLRLVSNLTLHIARGATIKAASVPFEGLASGGYDAAEPIDPAIRDFQDFGHGHWHNALIWGEGLSGLAIEGGGLIDGTALARDYGDEGDVPGSRKPGVGDKAIALKNCHGVTLRDISVLRGGWFCLLATAVDNLVIDNVTVDSNRDGFDIDCCRNVRVTNCTVNTPYDDGICPKSSFALGYARPTENVTIANCLLSGCYAVGSVIDGSFRRMPPTFNGTGRIKLGTESNGGFRNITITNCVCDQARGIALETVDGGALEDIAISNITMRGAQSSPLFLRLGRRLRGPAGIRPGVLRRVAISNIVSTDGPTMPSTIAGVPGFPVEDVSIADCHFHQLGGLSQTLLHYAPSAAEDAYPEPGMFGPLPATGLWARDARGLRISNTEIATTYPDNRPAVSLERVDQAAALGLTVPAGVPAFGLRGVTGFTSVATVGRPDWRPERADRPIYGP